MKVNGWGISDRGGAGGMRRVALAASLVTALALVFASAPVAADSDETEVEFEVMLTQAQERPTPTPTNAFGFAEVELKVVGDHVTIEFEVEVCNIQNVRQAHIHAAAAPGAVAPVRVFLFGLVPAPGFSATGCEDLSEGTFSAKLSDVLPGTPAMTVAGLVQAILSGNAYVNVHTTLNPAGEIRGQLVAEDDD